MQAGFLAGRQSVDIGIKTKLQHYTRIECAADVKIDLTKKDKNKKHLCGVFIFIKLCLPKPRSVYKSFAKHRLCETLNTRLNRSVNLA